jgi:uncharacterized protein YdiU (UPF0061 family)
VFSSIDQFGRYAFANQPRIAVWNLTRLAETLLPLIGADENQAIAAAEGALRGFQASYNAVFHAGLRRKIGLLTVRDGDLELIEGLFKAMAPNLADFTLTFRSLAGEFDSQGEGATRALFTDPTAFDAWKAKWLDRIALEPEHDRQRRQVMLSINPKYIPRNHRVEAVIRAATDNADFRPFEELLEILSKPFDEQPDNAQFADPPLPAERVLKTFCGT